MNREEHLERLKKCCLMAPITQKLEQVIEIPEKGKCSITMPFQPALTQNTGLMHGAVIFEAADTAGFIAANSTENIYSVLTAECNINFLRPVASGGIRAEATVVHRGKTLIVCTVQVYNEQGKLVAESRGTYLVSDIPLSEVPGYATPI